MPLTHKERMRRAIQHETVDRLPTQINYTGKMGKKLAEHFSVEPSKLPQVLDNHLIRVDVTYQPTCSEDGRVMFDWWGAGHDTAEEGYFIAVSPLAESKELDSYSWPDPREPGLLDGANTIIAESGGEYFITPNFGWTLFERAWALRGMQAFMMDMVLDPQFTHEILDHITDIQLILIARFIEAGVDGAYFGDDYGSQQNLLFSPPMWRKYIKPRLARLFEPFRSRNLPIIMHSDGHIQQILPDLIDIGLTTLNPVQPEVIDHHWLRKNFGGKLAFYGGISTQGVLPHGAPGDVRAAVAETKRNLAPDNTGLVIAPSHRLMTDIPMENVEALLEAFGIP
jgi:uroporphyrinogen decarboxylase